MEGPAASMTEKIQAASSLKPMHCTTETAVLIFTTVITSNLINHYHLNYYTKTLKIKIVILLGIAKLAYNKTGNLRITEH